LIVLDPGLRFREDGVCYHPHIGYFSVSETWINLLDLWDRKPRNTLDIECQATASVIAHKLIELGLAKETFGIAKTKRKRPLPSLADGITAPLDAEIYPTYRCNYRCRFCSSGEKTPGVNEKGDLPREIIGDLADRLDAVGLFNIGIVGGEPFLYSHLELLVDELISKGMHVHISTNGSIQPERIAGIYQPGLHLAVSVHGYGPEENDRLTGHKGSFTKALRTVEYLVQHDIPIRIISVIETPSEERIRRLAKRWANVGVSEMTFCRAIRIGRAKFLNLGNWDAESIERLERLSFDVFDNCSIKIHTGLRFRLSDAPEEQRASFYFKQNKRCDAGIRGLYIDPSGDLYPCESLARVQYRLGNILDDLWPELLKSSPIIRSLRNLRTPEACAGCSYLNVCRGGCPALSAQDNDDLSLPTMYCPFS